MNIKRISVFILLAYASAFFFEELPRTIFIEFLNHPHMRHLWEVRGGMLFFFIWYGAVFVVFYFLFSQKSVKLPVIFGVMFGMMAETFLFKKMNIVSFFLFPFLYGGMFYCPFKLIQKYKR